MEISLKIELSDDQYNNLIKNSYDELFKDEKLIAGLRELILSKITEYFTDRHNNPTSIIRDILLEDDFSKKDNTYYGNHYVKVPNSLTKKIVLDATELQMSALRNKIRIGLSELISNKEFIASAIYEILIDSIKAGIATGTENMIEEHRRNQDYIAMIANKVFKV